MSKRQGADIGSRDEIILTSPTSLTTSREFVFTMEDIMSAYAKAVGNNGKRL